MLLDADLRILVPGSMLAGAALLLVYDLISSPGAQINTVTALMGIPVVIIVIVHRQPLLK